MARRELRVLERCCTFEMCLDIEYFVRRKTWSFENFGISENSAFGQHFTCEFDCGNVHSEKMSSISIFQIIGLWGLEGSGCFFILAKKMTEKATVIFVSFLYRGFPGSVCN